MAIRSHRLVSLRWAEAWPRLVYLEPGLHKLELLRIRVGPERETKSSRAATERSLVAQRIRVEPKGETKSKDARAKEWRPARPLRRPTKST